MSVAKNVEQSDYDPFEHRQVEKPNSDIRSLANLVKASLGSGILAMPLAFSNAGWALGIVSTLIISFICGHCVHIFVKTSHECCKIERTPSLGYAETCRAAFANGPKRLRRLANTASTFAEFSLIFTYLGVCCIFTVLIADSIKQLNSIHDVILGFNVKMKAIEVRQLAYRTTVFAFLCVSSGMQLLDRYYPVVILPVEYYCLILLLPLCLMCQIRHLKWLAPISLLANILLFSTFAICLYYIFGDEITYSDKKAVGDLSRYPAFLSTVIFAMEGIGVVMPVENVMKKPQHFLGFPSVLVLAMAIITVLYCILGLFGYFRYGDVLRGSITLNLPLNDWPAICAKCFIALSIFLTYPLHFFVVIDVFTRYSDPYIKEKYRFITQVGARAIIVIFCGGIGIALPMLEQIINIVGALFYSILGLIIPGIIETVFRWENLGKYNWILWKNILIVIFGLGSLISGCLVTVMDIINILNRKIE